MLGKVELPQTQGEAGLLGSNKHHFPSLSSAVSHKRNAGFKVQSYSITGEFKLCLFSSY